MLTQLREGGSLDIVGAPRKDGSWLVPVFAGILGYAAFAQGGYYAPQGAAIAIALVITLVWGRVAFDASDRPAAVAFGVLAAALGVSAAVAGFPADAWRPATTLLSAAATFALVRRAIRLGHTHRLLAILAWIGTVVAVIGLVGVVFHAYPWAMRAQGLWRAASTLTYANSAGALLVLALPAPLLLLMRNDSALHRLQTFAILAGLFATLSRGAALGAIAMTIALAATGGRPLLSRMIRPFLCALGATVAMFPSIASWWARPVHALAGIVAGALIVAVPMRLSPMVKRVAAVALALGTVAAIVPAVAATEKPAQFITSRLGEARDDRTMFWRASLDTALDKPLFGTGPGTYRGILPDGDRRLLVFYVHNEYLQVLAETGAAGLASVVGAIGIFAVWAWRRRPAKGEHDRLLWAAAVSACVAFCVHGFFDFMWRMPAVVIPAFVWVALATREKGKVQG